MTRSSPTVARVVGVLNFFADHPGQSFTLTDLVRALRISRATCHALLVGLVDAGYLYRATDKRYVLGPALVAAGRAAAQGMSPLQIAQPEMRILADRYDAVCSMVAREGDEGVILDRAASVSNLGYSPPLRSRVPLRPPFAGIFFAWSDPARVTAWIEALAPKPSTDRIRQMEEVMAFARGAGYSFGVHRRPAGHADAISLADLGVEDASYPLLSLIRLDPDATYYMPSLQAPVFDADGAVSLVLAMVAIGGGDVAGADIAHQGDDLRQAAERITRFIGGRSPFN